MPWRWDVALALSCQMCECLYAGTLHKPLSINAMSLVQSQGRILIICKLGGCIQHSLSCRLSAGRLPWHAAINTIVKMSLARAQIPSTLEPSGLSRSDGKRPDGVTITPWQAGRTLVWDVTCPDTYAASHMILAMRENGTVAALTEKKTIKYGELARTHYVAPLVVETSGAFGQA